MHTQATQATQATQGPARPSGSLPAPGSYTVLQAQLSRPRPGPRLGPSMLAVRSGQQASDNEGRRVAGRLPGQGVQAGGRVSERMGRGRHTGGGRWVNGWG